jgi:hypothetical protein
MLTTNCWAVAIGLLALHSAAMAQTTDTLESRDPRPKSRAPDDRMLRQLPRETREVRDPIMFDEVTSKVNLDADSLFGELPLPRSRGTEEPSGSIYGRYCQNGFARAGYPFCIGRFAKPSTDTHHQVGYVGGGTLFGGSGRRRDEGTFGMDYSGAWFSRMTWLKWSHGARYQGGAGRYETEGSRILPE